MPDIKQAQKKLIGHNLRALRKSAGLSLQDIADILRVSYQQVQKYEMGKNRLPAGSIAILCDVFGVSFEQFFINPATTADAALAGRVTPDWTALYVAFNRVRDPAMRRKVIGIVDILASA